MARERYILPDDVSSCVERVSSRLSSFRASDFLERELLGPSVHLLGARSKLLRPTLVLLGAKAVGEKPSRFIDLAVAAELIHVSSLVHDDIVDCDTERRGLDAVHVKYGSEMAILAGDALISKAVELASEYGKAVLQSISRATMSMCAGEALDYRYQKLRKVPDMKQYSRIATLKSGALIGASWNAVAVYKSSRIARQMYDSGCDLGVAFQVRDDILDFIRATKTSGMIPNAVTSIMRNGMGKYDATVEAMKLNNSRIDAAVRRLSGTRAGDMLSSYSQLVRVIV